MKFMGSYSVFHISKHHARIDESLRIKNAKWVNDLCSMMLQFIKQLTYINIKSHLN